MEEKEREGVVKPVVKASVKPVVKAAPPVDPEEEMIKQMGREWNIIVNSMMTAEKAWRKILEMQQGVSKQKLMFAPLEVQKALSRFGRAQFNVMLARFVDYYRAQGGLEAMKIKEVK